MEPSSVQTQPSVAEPATTSSPVEKPKSKLPFLLLVLVLGALLLGGGYYLGKLQKSTANVVPSPTSDVIITPDPTTDWITYTNSSLGFELKYPPEVQIDKELNDQNNMATIFKGGNLHFEVMLRKNPGDIILDNYHFMDSLIKSKTSLGGISSNVYEMPNGYCDGPSCSEPYIAIVTEKDSTLYHISFFGDAQLSEAENQILFTFKFINPLPPAVALLPTPAPDMIFQYSLPTGWSTSSISNFDIGYDQALFRPVCVASGNSCELLLKSSELFKYGVFSTPYSGSSLGQEMENRFGKTHDKFVGISVSGKNGLFTTFRNPAEFGGNKQVAGIPNGKSLILFTANITNTFGGNTSGFDLNYVYQVLKTLQIK